MQIPHTRQATGPRWAPEAVYVGLTCDRAISSGVAHDCGLKQYAVGAIAADIIGTGDRVNPGLLDRVAGSVKAAVGHTE